MNKIVTLLVSVFSVTIVGGGAYYFGHNQGYSEGYSHGHDIGWSDAKRQPLDNQLLINALDAESNSLRVNYTKLLGEYNSLAARTNMPERQFVKCTNNTIGSYTYTTCY